MAQAVSTGTKQQVLKRLENDIKNLEQRLDSEKDYHKQLFYEEMLTKDMIENAETIEETSQWEMEQAVLQNMMKMSEKEIEELQEELYRQYSMATKVKKDLN